MYLLGYSLDNLSLMAMTLSVGFVVDDAIVMLENIVRHMEMGKAVLEAAFDGSGEIGFTILSMTFSLAAVFIPVLFMGGIIGRLLHEFAVTIGVAILVSGFVSLTLTPMLCSRFLRPPAGERHGRLYQITERWFDGMLDALSTAASPGVMRHRRMPAGRFRYCLSCGTFWGFRADAKGFLPDRRSRPDSDVHQAAQGISYDAMVQHQQVSNHMLATIRTSDVLFERRRVGARAARCNTGILFTLAEAALERKLQRRSVDRRNGGPSSRQIPGMIVFLQNPPPIQHRRRSSPRAPIN